jgi:prephenate dehydratase
VPNICKKRYNSLLINGLKTLVRFYIKDDPGTVIYQISKVKVMNIKNEEIQSREYEESRESFSKSLFYIQLISLILAIISFFFIN